MREGQVRQRRKIQTTSKKRNEIEKNLIFEDYSKAIVRDQKLDLFGEEVEVETFKRCKGVRG